MKRLLNRIKLAWLAFNNAPKLGSIVYLRNGVGIDLEKNKIILSNSTHFHCEGDLVISSDKHVIIESGKGSEDDRPGYKNSIWFNPNKDQLGRPIVLIAVRNDKNEETFIEAVYDSKNELVLPIGFRLLD